MALKFATVTSINPLRVRISGETTDQAAQRSVVRVDANLAIGDAVTVEIINRYLTVVGKVGGDNVRDFEIEPIGSGELADFSIIEQKLADHAISRRTIVDDAIDASKVAQGNVVKALMAVAEIDGTHIGDNAISTPHIVAGSIESGHIAAGTIEGDRIAAFTIDATNIASYNLTALNASFENGIIQSAMIGDAQIVDAHIDNLSANKITFGTLSGISISAVTVDGSTITGGVIRTSSALTRVEMNSTWFDSFRMLREGYADSFIGTNTAGNVYIQSGGGTARVESDLFVSGQIISGQATIQIANDAHTAAAVPSAYPVGRSRMGVSAGWVTNMLTGLVITEKNEKGTGMATNFERAIQYYTDSDGTTMIRGSSGNVWSAWKTAAA